LPRDPRIRARRGERRPVRAERRARLRRRHPPLPARARRDARSRPGNRAALLRRTVHAAARASLRSPRGRARRIDERPGRRAAAGDVLLFVDADCLLPSNLVETVFLALGDPHIVGGATGFAPAKGRRIERSLFYFANAYQRAMTIWGLPHNAGYCFFFRKSA